MKRFSIAAAALITLCLSAAPSLAADELFYCELTDTQYFSVLECTDACKENCSLEEGDDGFYLCFEKARRFLESVCVCDGNKAAYIACMTPKFIRLRNALKSIEKLNVEGVPLVTPGSAIQLRNWVKDQIEACE